MELGARHKEEGVLTDCTRRTCPRAQAMLPHPCRTCLRTLEGLWLCLSSENGYFPFPCCLLRMRTLIPGEKGVSCCIGGIFLQKAFILGQYCVAGLHANTLKAVYASRFQQNGRGQRQMRTCSRLPNPPTADHFNGFPRLVGTSRKGFLDRILVQPGRSAHHAEKKWPRDECVRVRLLSLVRF
jgi:hypothetical protein